MSEFRTGNKGKSHPYPATPHSSAGAAALFARNSAVGSSAATVIEVAGTQLIWAATEMGVLNSVNVAITPKSTGIVRISGHVTVFNDSVADEEVTIQAQVAGVTLATPFARSTVAAGGQIAIPFEASVLGLAIGVATNIQILASGSVGVVLSFVVGGSDVALQEVTAASG